MLTWIILPNCRIGSRSSSNERLRHYLLRGGARQVLVKVDVNGTRGTCFIQAPPGSVRRPISPRWAASVMRAGSIFPGPMMWKTVSPAASR
jgi:hypothetical protein